MQRDFFGPWTVVTRIQGTEKKTEKNALTYVDKTELLLLHDSPEMLSYFSFSGFRKYSATE